MRDSSEHLSTSRPQSLVRFGQSIKKPFEKKILITKLVTQLANNQKTKSSREIENQLKVPLDKYIDFSAYQQLSLHEKEQFFLHLFFLLKGCIGIHHSKKRIESYSEDDYFYVSDPYGTFSIRHPFIPECFFIAGTEHGMLKPLALTDNQQSIELINLKNNFIKYLLRHLSFKEHELGVFKKEISELKKMNPFEAIECLTYITSTVFDKEKYLDTLKLIPHAAVFFEKLNHLCEMQKHLRAMEKEHEITKFRLVLIESLFRHLQKSEILFEITEQFCEELVTSYVDLTQLRDDLITKVIPEIIITIKNFLVSPIDFELFRILFQHQAIKHQIDNGQCTVLIKPSEPFTSSSVYYGYCSFKNLSFFERDILDSASEEEEDVIHENKNRLSNKSPFFLKK